MICIKLHSIVGEASKFGLNHDIDNFKIALTVLIIFYGFTVMASNLG